MSRPVFLYGPLAHPPLRAAFGAMPDDARAAWLSGHGLRCAASGDEGAPPLLVAAPGEAVEGLLLPDPEPDLAARIGAYGTALGLEPCEVVVESGAQAGRAALSWRARGRAEGAWDVEEWARRDGAMAALVAEEILSLDPVPGPDDTARQMPMMRSRAAARLRAASTPAPARLRHDPLPGQWRLEPAAALSGGFFRLAQMRMSHHRFDGGENADLRREVLVGIDAALVLAYDPARDRVLLVEQFRAGPARRGSRNPWILEPVAGIVDAGETPIEAGRREGREEAGLVLSRLEPIFSGYPSPGSSTDFFHCFLAVAELPQQGPWAGGLEAEHEDLRLHVVALDLALEMIGAGEIDALPLIAMLYWLHANRARLRAEAEIPVA
ncbi:NUDIX domain-containing protein [Limimaricola pyoseonensis]|uniref:Nudix-type nucleoside diphosphatase, YffH/AdpP family n=1 Tax=Limimaricola pyoseonensis TaxID=521013 RepID=A0A1G7GU08_9RHOB|nr:NUDIX domain-containing protein [Limimaricola pyoseonensis]SDE91429.1 nudix-type nucleoside diphosphatase, YffH/AdpP family [Limimaricola pyoseonensis]